MGLVNVDLDPETIIDVRLIAYCDKYKKCKACKKDKQRINACRMVYNNIEEIAHVRRWQKRNTTIFGWWKVV